MGQAFEQGGIREDEVVRGDHKTGITAGGKALDLIVKVPLSRGHHLIAAPLKTFPEHPKHCCTLRGKPGVVCHGIFSKKHLHYQIIGRGSDL